MKKRTVNVYMTLFDKVLEYHALIKHRKIKRFVGFLFKYKEKILLLSILVLGFILRFYDFFNRWGLAYDQARDLIVANYALQHFTIPLIGPFSSAGAFVYGPQWFWILMVFEIFSFGAIIGPWIILALLSVFSIFIMYLIGKEIEGVFFGMVAAFIAAISVMQISQATNLTSPSMVGIFSIITCYFFIRYIKYSRKFDAFFLGFLISNSINIHFQAIGLIVLAIVAFIFTRKKISNLLILILGLLIPFIPLFIFDLKTNFYESRNILDYYLYGQYRIYVPNRWLTYALTYWPHAWGKIIGGNFNFLGYLFFFASFGVLAEKILNKTITKNILAFFLSFFLIFIILRYYRGERFESYLVFIHPLVFILSAWVLLRIYNFKKYIFFLLLVLVFIGSIWANILEIRGSSNNAIKNANVWRNALIDKFPKTKVAIYDYSFKYVNQSYPLVLSMMKNDLLSDGGKKIGFVFASPSSTFRNYYPSVYGKTGGYQLFDLSSSSSAQLSEFQWAFINPSMVYDSVELWYTHNK